jgi:hypothetical protein
MQYVHEEQDNGWGPDDALSVDEETVALLVPIAIAAPQTPAQHAQPRFEIPYHLRL